jgi:hypothetical protein
LLERAKTIATWPATFVGAVTALVTIVKAAQGAADEIPPILFGSGVALVAVILVGVSIFVATQGIREVDNRVIMPGVRHPDKRLLVVIPGYALVAAFGVGVLLDTHSLSTVKTGEYQGDIGKTVVFGSLGWLFTAALIIGERALAHKKPTWAPRGKKLCPECAEYPKAAARVCRYCGHRFSESAGG